MRLLLLLWFLFACGDYVGQRDVSLRVNGLSKRHQALLLEAVERWRPCYPFEFRIATGDEPWTDLLIVQDTPALDRANPKWRAYTNWEAEASFRMLVRPAFLERDDETEIRDVFTHELGHALPGFIDTDTGLMGTKRGTPTSAEMKAACAKLPVNEEMN